MSNATEKHTLELLVTSVSQAFETMAFLLSQPADGPLPAPREPIMVHMDFSGPVTGRTELMAGSDLVRQLAANVLGLEPDDPQAREKGIDAFKEMLNTTLGVLLPQLASTPADVFDVSLPQANIFKYPVAWDNFIRQADVVILDMDSHPLAVHLIESV